MTQAMADSIEQQAIFSQQDKNHSSFKAVPDDDLGESDEDCEHTAHLDLQDRMRHPVAFWSEMCGDVMHFGQAQQQPDSRQFVESVIKEINRHVKNQKIQACQAQQGSCWQANPAVCLVHVTQA